MKELRAKITSKGQITIPKEIREKIGLEPGREIYFEEKDGIFYIKKRSKNPLLINGLVILRTKGGNLPMRFLRNSGQDDNLSRYQYPFRYPDS